MPSARDKAKLHPGYEAAVQGRLCQPGAADVGSARGTQGQGSAGPASNQRL